MATSSAIPETKESSGKRNLVTTARMGAGRAGAGRFSPGGGTVIVTARSASEEDIGSHFIQADVSSRQETIRLCGRQKRR